jgi:hypothetical protein
MFVFIILFRVEDPEPTNRSLVFTEPKQMFQTGKNPLVEFEQLI